LQKAIVGPGDEEVAKAVVPVTWRLDPELFARIQAAAASRGVSVQAFASEALERAVEGTTAEAPTAEDLAWLEADLSRLGEFEAYDWGPNGVPEGRPVRYVPGKGLIIEDRRG
jgi:predicted transcriptional regulator